MIILYYQVFLWVGSGLQYQLIHPFNASVALI